MSLLSSVSKSGGKVTLEETAQSFFEPTDRSFRSVVLSLLLGSVSAFLVNGFSLALANASSRLESQSRNVCDFSSVSEVQKATAFARAFAAARHWVLYPNTLNALDAGREQISKVSSGPERRELERLDADARRDLARLKDCIPQAVSDRGLRTRVFPGLSISHSAEGDPDRFVVVDAPTESNPNFRRFIFVLTAQNTFALERTSRNVYLFPAGSDSRSRLPRVRSEAENVIQRVVDWHLERIQPERK